MERNIVLLSQSAEPAIRYKTHVNLLDQSRGSPHALALQQAIKDSPRVQTLLSERSADGRIPCHPYKKWYGAHWVLVSLAELNYPPGDQGLIPLREQILEWLLSESHQQYILNLQGRTRRCASQESNAIFSLLTLGIADERVEELVRRLLKWQWPDGGWNCDKRPETINSSFMETITPLRALTLYARLTGNSLARTAVDRAAEVFLKRQLFLRQSNGQVINPHFLKLHYPLYWHYDVLHALGILADTGFLSDNRCQAALTHLKAQRLPDGGFPAQEKFYHPANPAHLIPISERTSGYSLVNWGPTGSSRANEFVSVEALRVLGQSGILSLEDEPRGN